MRTLRSVSNNRHEKNWGQVTVDEFVKSQKMTFPHVLCFRC
jgi:hypothetical protein